MTQQPETHDWLRRARGVMLEAHLPPFFPKIEFDALHTVRMMKRISADMVCIGAIGKWAGFPNRFIPPHPDLGERDLLAEIIEAARVEKMRVAVSVPVSPLLPVELVEKRKPDWQWIGPAGKPRYLSYGVGGPVTPVCLNSAYRLAFFDVVRWIVSNYDIHAICFESLSPPDFTSDDVCYCEACKKAVAEKFNRELPPPTTTRQDEKEIVAHFQNSYRKLRLNVIKEAREAAVSIKKIAAICVQTGSSEDVPPEQLEEFDALMVDAGAGFIDHVNAASFRPGRKAVVMQRIGTGDRWPRLLLRRNELAREVIATVACGAAPTIAQANKLFFDEVKAPPIARTFAFMIRNEEALRDLEPVGYAAVCTSGRGPEPMTDEARGLTYALANARVPVRPVPPAILDSPDDLSRCRVLCLGDIGRIPRERIERISEFVEKGGGLVATHRTSLLDDAGREGEAFGLGDVLGVKPMKPSMEQLNKITEYQWRGEPNDVYIAIAQQEAAALDVTHLPKQLPQARFVAVEAKDDAFVAAHTQFGDGDRLCPAVVLRAVGEGRTVYISSALGALYLDRRLPAVLDLIEACVAWAGGDEETFSVFGPASLFAIMNEKPGLRVLFLVNCTGERHERPGVPCEHFAPLENIAVRLRTTKPVGLIRELVSGAELDFERDKSTVRLTVPRIEDFAAVAFYGQGPKADPGLRL